MPRKIRIEYPDAIYHVMSRGDRRKEIFPGDANRQYFKKTRAERCQKTVFKFHAYGLVRSLFHLVVKPPTATLVAGMPCFLTTYALRLTPRHNLCGHVFSGR